jgi:uncharacterized protein YcfL
MKIYKLITILLGSLMLVGCYSSKSLGTHPERNDKYIFIY